MESPEEKLPEGIQENSLTEKYIEPVNKNVLTRTGKRILGIIAFIVLAIIVLGIFNS